MQFAEAQVITEIREVSYPMNQQSAIQLSFYNPANANLICGGNIRILNQSGEEKIQYEISGIQIIPGQSTVTLYLKNCRLLNEDSLVRFQMNKLGGLYGSYQVCINLEDKTNGLLVSQSCKNYSFEISLSESANKLLKKITDNKWIQLHGRCDITSNVSNTTIPGSEIPANFIMLNSSQSITVLGVPLNLQISLTSISNEKTNPQVFTISFDKNQYEKKIDQKLELLKLEKQRKELDKMTDMKEYEKIQKKLDHPYIAEKLKQIKLYDSLKNQLTEAVNKKLPVDIDSLNNIESRIDKKILLLQEMKPDSGKAMDSLLFLANRNDTIQKLLKLKDSVVMMKNKAMNIYKRVEENKELLKGDVDINKLYKQVSELSYIEKERKGYDELLVKEKKYRSRISEKTELYEKYKDFNVEKLKEPDEVINLLRKNKYISKFDNYLRFVNNFQIGMAVPAYSAYTLMNLPVKGLHTQFQYKSLMIAYSGGTILDPMIIFDSTNSPVSRKVNALKIGYVFKKAGKIDFIAADINEKLKNHKNQYDTAYFIRQKRNTLVSCLYQVNMLKNTKIEGECALSLYNRDKTSGGIDSFMYNEGSSSYYDSVESLRHKVLFKKYYQTYDLAFRIKINQEIPKTNTRISLTAERIGKDYYTMGVPFIIKNLKRYEAKISQSFFKKKVRVGLLGRYDSDGKKDSLNINPVQVNYGFDLQVNLSKCPYIIVSFLPVRLYSDSFDYRLNNLVMSAGYYFKIKKTGNNINLMYNRQDGYNSINNQAIGSENINGVYSIQTKIPLTISLNYARMKYNLNDSNIKRQAYGGEISYSKKKLITTAGCRYNVNSFIENNLDGYVVISYVLKDNLQLRMRIEKNTYQNYLYPEYGVGNYNKINGMLTVNYTW